MTLLFVTTLLAAHLSPAVAGEAMKEPQLAVSGQLAALAYGQGNAIYFAASGDAGATFAKPVKVAEAPLVPLTRHRGPRIAIAGSVIVITAVTGRHLSEGPHAHGLPSDGDLMSWRSSDKGRTWTGGPAINDVPASATEGLHSLASNSRGDLVAVWLDKRSGHGTELYTSTSRDRGKTWAKNVRVYRSPQGTICECCHPSVAMDSDGGVAVMWRNWLNGSRDMYLVRSGANAEFVNPERLGIGTWKLNACPMDGGGMAFAKGTIVTAWRREGDVFLASPGTPEQRIGTGKDIALAGAGGRVYVAWAAPDGIVLWSDGQQRKLAPAGSFPALAVSSSGTAIAAWELKDGIEVLKGEER